MDFLDDTALATAIAHEAARQQASADRLNARPLSIARSRDHENSNAKTMVKLAHTAVRLSRRAGVKGVTVRTFDGRTKNQLINTIRELSHYLETQP